jgi:hypothetical protein
MPLKRKIKSGFIWVCTYLLRTFAANLKAVSLQQSAISSV